MLRKELIPSEYLVSDVGRVLLQAAIGPPVEAMMTSLPCPINISRNKNFQVQASNMNVNIIFAVTDVLSAGTDGLLTPDAYEQLIDSERVHTSAILIVNLDNKQSAGDDVIVNNDLQVVNSDAQVSVDVDSGSVVYDLEPQICANDLRELQRADRTLKSSFDLAA